MSAWIGGSRQQLKAPRSVADIRTQGGFPVVPITERSESSVNDRSVYDCAPPSTPLYSASHMPDSPGKVAIGGPSSRYSPPLASVKSVLTRQAGFRLCETRCVCAVIACIQRERERESHRNDRAPPAQEFGGCKDNAKRCSPATSTREGGLCVGCFAVQ